MRSSSASPASWSTPAFPSSPTPTPATATRSAYAAREFERAGVAALHLEDQVFPQRCGHYDDKAVVPTAEMVQKLRAARDAAQDDDLVIIARTDTIAVEGLDAAIDRAHAYFGAGADVLFVEAPTSEAQIEIIARSLPGPKLINMFEGGKTPLAKSRPLQIRRHDDDPIAQRLQPCERDRSRGGWRRLRSGRRLCGRGTTWSSIGGMASEA